MRSYYVPGSALSPFLALPHLTPQLPWGSGWSVILLLEIGKVRHREGRPLARGHTADARLCWDPLSRAQDLMDLESSMICHLQWDGASKPRACFLRWVEEKVRGTGYVLPTGGSPPLALPGPRKHGMSPLHSQLFLRTPCRVGNTGTCASLRVPVCSADTWPHSPQARLWRSSSVSISIPKQDPALPKVQTNMDLKQHYFNPLSPK